MSLALWSPTPMEGREGKGREEHWNRDTDWLRPALSLPHRGNVFWLRPALSLPHRGSVFSCLFVHPTVCVCMYAVHPVHDIL